MSQFLIVNKKLVVIKSGFPLVNLSQMVAPAIELSGDNLIIQDNDGRAESFDIYADGTKKATVTKGAQNG